MHHKALLTIIACGMMFGGCAATRTNEMTMMSFNVRHCAGSDMKLDVSRVAAAIASVRPRFAALQELDVKAKRSDRIDEPAELARLTGMKATFGKTIDFQGGAYGVMLLSKDDPISVTKVPLPGKEPRLLLLAEFDDCVVGSTHLSVANEKERMDSVGLIRDAVAKFTKPVFVCGDWNARPDSPVLKELGKFLAVLSPTDQNTFHGTAPKLLSDPKICIDYIAVDKAHAKSFRVLEGAVVPDTVSSDHKPIFIRLKNDIIAP
jgi:endonuclease/exonuclease/phosphatase family metal-dependent hydrolase